MSSSSLDMIDNDHKTTMINDLMDLHNNKNDEEILNEY